jgi:hypothetical protein
MDEIARSAAIGHGWWVGMSTLIKDFLKKTKEKCVMGASEAERSGPQNLDRHERRSTEP